MPIAEKNTLMCVEYNIPIADDGVCSACHIHHDMQSTYILRAGYPLPAPNPRYLTLEAIKAFRQIQEATHTISVKLSEVIADLERAISPKNSPTMMRRLVNDAIEDLRKIRG